MSVLLLIPFATGLLGLFVVYVVFQIRKITEDEQTKNNQKPDIQHLWKSNPINARDGWLFDSVINGVTIWWKKERKASMEFGIYGCQALVQASAEDVITQLLLPKVLALTDISVDDVHIIPNHGSRASKKDGSSMSVDFLLITEKSSTWMNPLDLKSMYISWKHTHKIRRLWSNLGTNQHSLVLVPDNHLLTHKLGLWTSFLVRELQGGAGNGLSLLTILSVPTSGDYLHTNLITSRISSQILCLREHLDSLCISRLLSSNNSKEIESHNSRIKLGDEVNCSSPAVSTSSVSSAKELENAVEEKPNQKIEKSDFGTEETPASVKHIAMTKEETSMNVELYTLTKEVLELEDFIKDAFDVLYAVHKADSGTPGWSYQGNTKGVDVYKMTGDSSCPADCYKGATDVQVPLSYALQYCASVDYKLDWDDLYAGGKIIKDFDVITKITHLEYKAVWPTSGRDFVSLSCTRHLLGNLYGIAVKAFDYSYPEVKGKVRGEIILGGFLMEEISSDPPCTRVTYVTRADLKGNVPTRLVNKVTSAQPLYAIKLRDRMEERFENNDPPQNDEVYNFIRAYPSMYEERKQARSTTKQKEGENKYPASTETNSNHSEKEDKLVVSESPLKPSDKEPAPNSLTVSSRNKSDDNLSLSSACSVDTLVRECSPSEFGEDTSPVSDLDFDLPRDQRGNIDFQTLGNQASASLLEEAFFVSKMEIVDSQQDLVGEWTYQGTKKDIKMFRKVHEGESIHSFMGFGEMDVVATTVWDAIKNPATRFIYDNMLKKTEVVKEVGKGYKILHMRHETTACFVKQARDFVVLTSERTEGNRYVLSGISVDLPECPPQKDCVRGRVLSSGWIIEPILKGRKSCSQVIYLSQINFGGRLPARLINHVAKRQPLSISYLRDYLQSVDST